YRWAARRPTRRAPRCVWYVLDCYCGRTLVGVALSEPNHAPTCEAHVHPRHEKPSLNISPIQIDGDSLAGSNHVCRLPKHIVDCGIQHGMVEYDVVASNPEIPWQPHISSLDRHRRIGESDRPGRVIRKIRFPNGAE